MAATSRRSFRKGSTTPRPQHSFMNLPAFESLKRIPSPPAGEEAPAALPGEAKRPSYDASPKISKRKDLFLWKICQPGRVWKPTLLEDLTDPRNGGRIGRSGRVKAISRRVAAVWPRGAYPWMPRGLWRLQATEGGPWGRPWRVPRTLLRSSALRRSAGKSASLLLLCLPRNLCNSNSHPRCC